MLEFLILSLIIKNSTDVLFFVLYDLPFLSNFVIMLYRVEEADYEVKKVSNLFFNFYDKSFC